MKKKLLLHICCAPCSASAVKMLKDRFDMSFYWYNPNIYEEDEYLKRKQAAVEYARQLGIDFYEEQEYKYDYEEWLTEGFERCEFCYKVRLSKAASFASRNSFDCFSTSLLSSPYQKHELVKKTGMEEAALNKTDFLYEDFRPFFYEGKNALRNSGYYIQKYCGCARSYKERFETGAKK